MASYNITIKHAHARIRAGARARGAISIEALGRYDLANLAVVIKIKGLAQFSLRFPFAGRRLTIWRQKTKGKMTMPSRSERARLIQKLSSEYGISAPYPSAAVQEAYAIYRMREDRLQAQRLGRPQRRPIPPEPELPPPYLSWIHIRDFLDPVDD